MSMHAVEQRINKIQDVRKITEEESWTRIWGGHPAPSPLTNGADFENVRS